MRALQVVAEAGPDGVVLTDVAEPEAELIVGVKAAGVSFPDLLMTRGEYQVRQPLPFTLGWEATVAMPNGLSYAEGAALPLNYLTALAALDRRGGLRPGERVLVHGAAGGVGSAAIQIAKGLGANVIACVSTPDKAD